MTALKLVGSGVDTLYFSVRGKLRDGVIEAFASIRSMAAGEPVVFQLAQSGSHFMLRPHGWRGYPTWLSSPNFELFLGAAEPFPPAFVELRSAFIHTLGAERAVAEVDCLLRAHLVDGPAQLTPSRIDVYADVQGWIPEPRDFERFSCRGIRRRLFEQPRQLHTVGRQLSGFTFGKRDIVARIYDKTLEMRGRDETWPAAVWTDVDPERPVWRVEFQYRRNALVTFGLRSMEQVLEARQELWVYGTHWLSLRTPSDDVNFARWQEAPEWLALRRARIGSSRSPLIRERIRAANQRRLVSGFVGYASSIAATGVGEGLEETLNRAVPLARRYLADRGIIFVDIVERKRRERLALTGPAPRSPELCEASGE